MGHHCQTCVCDAASDTRLFTRYSMDSDARDSSQIGKCSSCKGVGADVIVTYSSGARRYYDEHCARTAVGWNGEFTSTTAETLLVARAQLEAEVITAEEFMAIVDSVGG